MSEKLSHLPLNWTNGAVLSGAPALNSSQEFWEKAIEAMRTTGRRQRESILTPPVRIRLYCSQNGGERKVRLVPTSGRSGACGVSHQLGYQRAI